MGGKKRKREMTGTNATNVHGSLPLMVSSWVVRFVTPLGLDLGKAAEPLQISRVMKYLAFYLISDRLINATIKYCFPDYYKKLDCVGKIAVSSSLTSILHAFGGCFAALSLMIYPDSYRAMIDDKARGFSDIANNAFAFTSAFFLFDTIVLFRTAFQKGVIEKLYLVHHLMSFAAYTVVQYPYGQFYALLMLMYECSSPLLSIRSCLLHGGYKGSNMLKTVERAFGYCFVFVRIFFGLPLATCAVYDQARHYDRAPSKFYFWFLFVTTIGVNSLNVFWTKMFLAKREQNNKEDEEKPTKQD